MGKSICFVMPTIDGDDIEQAVSVPSGEFARNRCDVTLSLTNNTHTVYALNKRIHIDTPYVESNLNFLDQIRVIRVKMRVVPDTVFISFMDNQNLLTLIAGIGMRNRTITSQRSGPHRIFGKCRLIMTIHPWPYVFADYVVFQIQDALECYPRYAAGKYRVILNPLNDSMLPRYEGERSKRVVTICRLNDQRNLPLTIDAFTELRVRFRDYTFEIYDKGTLENDLRRHTVSRGVNDSVHFCGFRKDVHARILDTAVFVTSSDFEGLLSSTVGTTTLGIPTITTDYPIGGACMVIDNDINGYLIPVRNKERMAMAMRSIVDSTGV